MKKLLIGVLIVLMAAVATADDSEDARTFFRMHRPYSDSLDRMMYICDSYAYWAFLHPRFDDLYVTKLDDGVYLVTYESFVGAPRTTIKNRSELKAALDTITKTQYKLKLEWHIDTNKKTVEPHNFLARDCLKQYEEMYAMFGMNQEHKQSAKKTGPAWKFAW